MARMAAPLTVACIAACDGDEEASTIVDATAVCVM
jgi:hypothetical protein